MGKIGWMALLPRRFCAAFCGYAPEALQRWSSQVDFKLQLWSRVVLMCKWRAVLNFLLLLQSFVFYKRIDQGKRTRVLKKVFLSSFFASLQKTTTTAVVSTLVFFLQFSYFGTATLLVAFLRNESKFGFWIIWIIWCKITHFQKWFSALSQGAN